MLSTILLVSLALAAIYVVRATSRNNALKQFGGHWSAGWSRIWLLRTQGSGEMNLRFTALNEKYGRWSCFPPFCADSIMHCSLDQQNGYTTCANLNSVQHLENHVIVLDCSHFNMLFSCISRNMRAP
jgi:hypothetical protein